MIRKMALAVALSLGTVTLPAHALGLGDIQSHSALNQNLQADIDLLSIAAGELDSVRVRLGTDKAFARAGVERPYFLTQLKFTPQVLDDGRSVIRVTSKFPIHEPFLNFLVEVNWPRGRLVREYTVLLDPPTTTRRVAPRVEVARSTAPISVSRPQPAPRQAVMPSEPVVAKPVQSSANEYLIKENDTLWGITSRLRPKGVSIEQMMIALQRVNPHAFIDNNINLLRKGQILRVPGLEEIEGLDLNQARSAYREQQDEWLNRRAEKMQKAEVGTAAAAKTDDDAHLRIATARPEGKGEAGASEDTGDALTVDDLQNKLLLARENAESSRQESEGLRSEVEDLRKRMEDMQRLLSLKDQQLAQLQANVADGVTESAEGTMQGLESLADSAAAEQPFAEAELDPVEAAMQEAQQAFAEESAPLAAAEEAVADAELGATEISQAIWDAADAVAAANTEALAQPLPVPAAPVKAPEPVAEQKPEPVAKAAVEEKPAPAVEEKVAEAQPVQSEPVQEDSGLMWYIAGGGIATLLLLGALLLKRRQDQAEVEGLTDGPLDIVLPDEVASTEKDELDADSTLGGDSTMSDLNEPLGAPATRDTSFLSEFAPGDVSALQEDTGEVDPASEADVYMAYGRYQQAKELLIQAIERDPDRLPLKHKLLEVHHAMHESDDFVTLAQKIHAAGEHESDPAAWARSAVLGREISPGNPLFDVEPPSEDASDNAAALAAAAVGGIAAAGAATASEAEQDQDDAITLDDLDFSSLNSELLEETPDKDQDLDMTLDLDDMSEIEDAIDADSIATVDDDSLPIEGMESLEIDLPDLDSELIASSGASPIVESLDEDLMSLDQLEGSDSLLGEDSELSIEDLEAHLDQLSELSVLDSDLNETEPDIPPPPLESPAPLIEDDAADALDQPLSLDDAFDTDDLDDLAAADGSPEESIIELASGALDVSEDEVATKLDLARAYIDMGDPEGAKEILQEVRSEGNDAQKSEADTLLESVG